ncbi:MAG: amidoligase family protein [Patescibacteria group bacterium]|nr:amidoligase family protein [Patescibacteria group bacterium]
MMKTKINLVGFEIEGIEDRGSLADSKVITGNGELKSDGSINTEEEGEDARGIEFASRPFALRSPAIKKVFDEFQDRFYNGIWKFNDSCGFHIHYSFKPRTAPEIFSVGFARFMLKHIEAEYPDVWSKRRFNSYCSVRDCGAEDVFSWEFGNVDRYQAINFLPSYRDTKTIEFRIWPADEPRKMEEYLNYTTGLIRKYLARPRYKIEGKEYQTEKTELKKRILKINV